MDERRAGNADAVIVPDAPVSPFGNRMWIGTVLGMLYVWSAVWTILDRVLSRLARELGGEWLRAGYETAEVLLSHGIGAIVLIALFASAMGSTESLPDKGAFAAFAAALLMQSIGMTGGLWLAENAAFYLAAVCVPLAGMLHTAACLAMAVNRENCRDAQRVSLICAGIYILHTLAALASYYAVWMLTQTGAADVWAPVLGGVGKLSFFVSIAGGVLTGLDFWLLRTPVPVTTYPEKTQCQ